MQSELLGLSFDASAVPRIDLHLHPGAGKPSASWGVAWYPTDDPNVSFMKDTHCRGDLCVNDRLPSNEQFGTSVVVAHTRVETKRAMRRDAQPFRRPFGGADCVFAHAGDLNLHADPGADAASLWLNPGFPPAFQPVGSTDSERLFCRILQRHADASASSLGSLGWETLHGWLQEANRHGTMSVVLSNGRDLIAYADAGGARPLWQCRWLPPREETALACGNHTVTLDEGEDVSRTMFAFTSRPGPTGGWAQLKPGQMMVVRNADALWTSDTHAGPSVELPRREITDVQSSQIVPQPGEQEQADGMQTQTQTSTPDRQPPDGAPSRPSPRTLRVSHETRYVYTDPVQASQHLIRLRPLHDYCQELLNFSLLIDPAGEQVPFEDVFGNHALRLHQREPYTDFTVRMEATVRIDWAGLLTLPLERETIPLTWMPWQRQMMHAYLLPPELPETQLRELSEYATSFVERRDYDLVETLIDINNSIRRDFTYLSGSTNTETTPFEVYTTRQGVCQDFANLFICMARLLGIPARYRVGYIYTGSDYENTIQSDATHAWAEAYLPNVGWRGFDPTNGCLAGPDHIRVASGRNFRDATPTSGTIFKGGANETLTIGVEVHDESGA